MWGRLGPLLRLLCQPVWFSGHLEFWTAKNHLGHNSKRFYQFSWNFTNLLTFGQSWDWVFTFVCWLIGHIGHLEFMFFEHCMGNKSKMVWLTNWPMLGGHGTLTSVAFFIRSVLSMFLNLNKSEKVVTSDKVGYTTSFFCKTLHNWDVMWLKLPKTLFFTQGWKPLHLIYDYIYTSVLIHNFFKKFSLILWCHISLYFNRS